MTSGVRLLFADVFGIAFVGGWVASFVAAIMTGVYTSSLLFALFVFAFGAVVFQAGLLPLVAIFNLLGSRWKVIGVCWVFFPLSGFALGLALSVIVIYPGAPTSIIGATSGLLAGVGCAWLWAFVQRYRTKFPAELEAAGRLLFAPSWITGKKETPPNT